MTRYTGGCHCGAIRYEASAEPHNHALCHCVDCRRSVGAPMVGWAMFDQSAVAVEGEVSTYASSENARRHFCIQCGTGLFYTNQAMLPDMIDIQSGTLDEPDSLPAQAHIQVAERLEWMASAHELPAFDRFPPQDGAGDGDGDS